MSRATLGAGFSLHGKAHFEPTDDSNSKVANSRRAKCRRVSFAPWRLCERLYFRSAKLGDHSMRRSEASALSISLAKTQGAKERQRDTSELASIGCGYAAPGASLCIRVQPFLTCHLTLAGRLRRVLTPSRKQGRKRIAARAVRLWNSKSSLIPSFVGIDFINLQYYRILTNI